MGISARWLKSLIGLRKVERQQHRKEDGDVGRIVQERDIVYQFHCQNQHSQDHDNLVTPEEFPHGNSPLEGDCDVVSCSEPAFSSLNVPLPQTEEELKEIWAATIIQTAFRAFMVLIKLMYVNHTEYQLIDIYEMDVWACWLKMVTPNMTGSKLKNCWRIVTTGRYKLNRKGSSFMATREDKYKQHRFKGVSALLPPVEIPASYFKDLKE